MPVCGSIVPILHAAVAAGAASLAAALGAALLAAGAALDAAVSLLPPHAASVSERAPSTAADLRTVVRFMFLLGYMSTTTAVVAVV